MLGLRLVLAGAHAGFLILAVTGNHPAGVLWNTLFLSINLWHAFGLLWARRSVQFSAGIEALYSSTFRVLPRRDFLEFWNQGQEEGPRTGPWLREGERPDSLFLVVDGTVVVEKDGAELNRLSSGRFFAEMGYLTRQPASASLRSEQPVVVRRWSYALLERWERDRPELWTQLQAVLGREMAWKIAEQNPRTRLKDGG
jgi:CRP-like cAMP-binding protein